MSNTVKKITTIGMLLAIQVVLGRFVAISLPTVKISFTFLPIVITAMLYGPLWGGAAAVMGDFLIAILGPYGYYPPMAITALLTVLISGVAGLIFGRGLELSGLLESFIGAMCALLILQAVFYPLIFKFGINKSRIVFFLLFMSAGGVAFLLNQVADLPKIDTGFFDRYFAVLMPLFLLALMGLSYLISQRIYGKKQF